MFRVGDFARIKCQGSSLISIEDRVETVNLLLHVTVLVHVPLHGDV